MFVLCKKIWLIMEITLYKTLYKKWQLINYSSNSSSNIYSQKAAQKQ